MQTRSAQVALLSVAGAVFLGTFATGAAGKDEIGKLRICGVDACRTVTHRNTIAALATAIGANEAVRQPPPAGYIVLVPVPARAPFAGYVFVPARGVAMLKWRGEPADWYDLGWAEPIMRRVARGLRPHPRPRTWAAVRWRSR